jgi:hypothetical protein
MDAAELMQVLWRELEAVHKEYVATGREDEFDRYVADLKAHHRWPFDE